MKFHWTKEYDYELFDYQLDKMVADVQKSIDDGTDFDEYYNLDNLITETVCDYLSDHYPDELYTIPDEVFDEIYAEVKNRLGR